MRSTRVGALAFVSCLTHHKMKVLRKTSLLREEVCQQRDSHARQYKEYSRRTIHPCFLLLHHKMKVLPTSGVESGEKMQIWRLSKENA